MAVKKTFIVNAKNGLNLREKPTKASKILQVLPYETKVTINTGAETPDGWAELKDGGYVMVEFLK